MTYLGIVRNRKAFMPKIVTANLLTTGTVVFFDDRGEWVPDVAKARLFADAAEAEDGMAAAERDIARALVVDPFVTDKTPVAGKRDMTLRDSIRAFGPTIVYGRQEAKTA